MTIYYTLHTGRGTLIAPTFRSHDITKSINCAKAIECGNLVQLYNWSGYTICTITKEDIVRIEK